VILVDSSVWIDHLRKLDSGLADLLNRGQVLGHPFVTGELACGNLRGRETVLSLMQNLPAAPVASDEEALAFIERRGLAGRGIGHVDAHLLCSVTLDGTAQFWTRDRRLDAVAEYLHLRFSL